MAATYAPAQPYAHPGYAAASSHHTATISARAVVAIVAAIVTAMLIGVAGGFVLGSIAQSHDDQRAVCEQQGPLARFNEAC